MKNENLDYQISRLPADFPDLVIRSRFSPRKSESKLRDVRWHMRRGGVRGAKRRMKKLKPCAAEADRKEDEDDDEIGVQFQTGGYCTTAKRSARHMI